MSTIEKKSRKSKKVQEEPVIVEEPVVVEEPVEVEETISTEETVSFSEAMKALVQEIGTLKTQIRTIETNLKSVRLLYKEELKANKSNKRRKSKVEGGEPRARHGFVKPTLVSDALASFLGEPVGSMIARPQVTKKISEYVKENNCFGPMDSEEKVNKTIIIPDAKLAKLLGPPVFLYSKKKPELGKGYNYFNLQSYLKEQNHFIKAEQ